MADRILRMLQAGATAAFGFVLIVSRESNSVPDWVWGAELAVFGFCAWVWGKTTSNDHNFVMGYVSAHQELAGVINESRDSGDFLRKFARAILVRVQHDPRFRGVDAQIVVERGEE